MSDERIVALRSVGFCSGLPEVVLAALARISARVQQRAGATIQLEGDPAAQMYIVAQGRVKILRVGTNGREQILNIIGPGSHFNTVPMFDGGPCPANAEAMTDVLLLALPRAPLLALLGEHPALAHALLAELSSRLRHMVNLVDELALHSVQGRLAGLLLDQAASSAGAPLTQAEMAARLGTVREMIGRSLKLFEAQGLIRLDRGVITILDRAGLAEQHAE
jgi:CRP-like cAMP-binding protein